MQTVWKAHFVNSQTLLVIACSFALIFISIVLFVKSHGTYSKTIRCVCVILLVLTISFDVSSFFSARNDWQYAQANQYVVEGVIEDYCTGNNGSDSFSVNGIYFLCTPVDNNLFAYTLTSRDRGCVIEGDGQHVRVTYCTQNGLNAILRIETDTKGTLLDTSRNTRGTVSAVQGDG